MEWGDVAAPPLPSLYLLKLLVSLDKECFQLKAGLWIQMFVLARFALDDVHELIDFKLHVVAGLVDDLYVLSVHVVAWMFMQMSFAGWRFTFVMLFSQVCAWGFCFTDIVGIAFRAFEVVYYVRVLFW